MTLNYSINTLDIDQLKALVLSQQEIIDEISQQYENLLHQVMQLRRSQYGQRSEQGIPGQGSLFSEASRSQEKEEVEHYEVAAHQRKKVKKTTLANLRRERIEYDLPEEQKICGCGCGVKLHRIGEDVLEQYEKIPEQTYIIEHVRFKYAGCKKDPKIITASMPRQPIDKGTAGPGLLADIIIKKYDDHLPLYRQSEIFAREGIDLARSTLCDWLSQCGLLLEPLVAQMKKTLLSSPKIHTDDTIIPVLDKDKDKTKTGRLWIYLGGGKTAPPCAVYDYTETRQQTGPMEFLKDYCGYLQADAYTGYDILYDKQQKDFDITEVACMAHVRRKFFEIAKSAKKTGSAHVALKFIQELYKIEMDAKVLDDAKRCELRQQKSLPILKEFKNWLDEKINQVLPKSPLGQAINYTLNNWEALNRYCEDGMLSIDNNAAERLMRVVAIGRKNYLFAGNDKGAKNAAIFYSLIETSKLNQVNPYHYLRDTLKRLPTQLNSKIEELLPWNWKPAEPLPT